MVTSCDNYEEPKINYNFIFQLYVGDCICKKLKKKVFITFLPGKINWAFDRDRVKTWTRWLSAFQWE